MIRIDSSNIKGANDAIKYSSKYLEKYGIEGKIIVNNGLISYVCEIGKGEKTLIFNGHLDVVPAAGEMFEPRCQDNRIYGRGSADMKAGCAAMINAIIRLSKEELECKIMLQLVPDEEDGGLLGTKYLAEKGYIGDFVICGEPTGLNINIQSKGFIRLEVLEHGKSAHGSRPWEGDNAIENAMSSYDKIMKLPFLKMESKFYSGSSVNLAKIDGGEIYNRVPDQCRMGLDIRYIPEMDPVEIIKQIESVVVGEVNVLFIGEGTNISTEDEYIKQLMLSIEGVTKKNSKFIAQHGSSDARHFTKFNVPAVELGPAGNNWHGDEEYVEIDSVLTYEEILIAFARKFNGVKE